MAAATAFLVGTTLAGLTMQAKGQRDAGQAAQRAGNSAAEREEYNATIADAQAEDALARGRDEASRYRLGVRQLLGTQRAGFASQGVRLDTGSPRDVAADTAYLGELDAQQIQANAEREAWGFRVEADDRRNAARVAREGGAAEARAGNMAAIGTAIGGANMLVSRYGWPTIGGGRRAPVASRYTGGAMTSLPKVA